MGGRSNVGKSTLVNCLVGRKVAIVTPKPQTTRRRLLGIRSDPDAQVIFIDTPGIHEAERLINRRMVEAARRALNEGDVVMGVVEAGETLDSRDRAFLAEMGRLARPKVLAVNKIDLVGRERMLPMLEQCREAVPEAEIVPVSALTGENVEELLGTLKRMLPEGPSMMPEDEYTDQSERMLAAEVIREKLFLKVHEEVPFSSAVRVEQFAEEPERKLIRIAALIVVERDSHKAIVIGAGGRMIKEIGTAARLELEEMLGSRVFLELHVKVDPHWTRNLRKLEEMGIGT
jgi:GTP-binding protein Era